MRDWKLFFLTTNCKVLLESKVWDRKTNRMFQEKIVNLYEIKTYRSFEKYQTEIHEYSSYLLFGSPSF